MKARLKKGKVISGRLAETFVNLGLAVRLGKETKKEIKPNKTAKDVADEINNLTTLEELDIYSDDKRQIVKTAYNKKLKELCE